jgi:phosphohistidine phosphatase
MRLMLLRHAKTEKAEPGMRDDERRLNERGQTDAPLIGAYMARHALIPDRVLVSTAERTRETWRRLAEALPARPRVSYEERLYNAGSETILALAKQVEPPARTLLIIGHNPGLHDLARLLIASGDVEAREAAQRGPTDVRPCRHRLRHQGLGQGAPARRTAGAFRQPSLARGRRSRLTGACAAAPSRRLIPRLRHPPPAWQYGAKLEREGQRPCTGRFSFRSTSPIRSLPSPRLRPP